MMMDWNTMQSMMGGGTMGGAWILMWLTYVLILVLSGLGIAALIKYLSKK